MGANFKLDASEFDRLEKAIKQYGEGAEKVINDVLHNEASEMLQESIKFFMPVSKRNKKHAKFSKSLTDEKGNLSITIKSTKKYSYLYFPDDGSSVRNPKRRAAGNQQFFRKGAEAKQNEIIDRCIGRLADALNK